MNRRRDLLHRRWMAWGAVALAVALGGCDKNPVKTIPPEPPSESRAWIGTYTSVSMSGDIVLDLVRSGDTVRGELVFSAPWEPHVFVSGTMTAESLVISVDRSITPNGAAFDLRARIQTDSSLVGAMSASPAPTGATVTCRALPRLRVVEDLAFDVPHAVKGMVYDGSQMWLSTTGLDYLLMSTAGQITGSVAVFHRNGHWTSDALTFDGSRLWGALPGAAGTPSGDLLLYSEILAFDAGGRRPDSTRVWHRTTGLAWDGTHFWSLPHVGSTILRFDGSGVVSDSLHLGIPDAIHLEFDGAHFWTLGWFLPRLYQTDAQGRVVAIGDLPQDPLAFSAGAIAVEGARLWYVNSRIGSATVHRLTIQ